MRIGNLECETFNDEAFGKVRSFFGIQEGFAADSFMFEDLKPSGGKGGDPLLLTSDSLFFIKQINTEDHKTLRNLEFCQSMCNHVTDLDNPSILSPIIAHFTTKKRIYIAMMNVMTFKGKYKKQYDLKGCADDKLLLDDGKKVKAIHKRVWSLGVHLGLAGEPRRIYKRGKLEALYDPLLPLSAKNKELVLNAIQNDTEWLKKWRLMDYSLIVGVIAKSQITENEELAKIEEVFQSSATIYGGKPLSSNSEHHGTEYTLYIGVIDFLQKWTMGKRVARKIKAFEHNKATIPPNQYATRFLTHFEHVLLAHDEDLEPQLKKRDERNIPHRCFPCSVE